MTNYYLKSNTDYYEIKRQITKIEINPNNVIVILLKNNDCYIVTDSEYANDKLKEVFDVIQTNEIRIWSPEVKSTFGSKDIKTI